MARSQSSESTAALTSGTKDGDFAERPRYTTRRTHVEHIDMTKRQRKALRKARKRFQGNSTPAGSGRPATRRIRGRFDFAHRAVEDWRDQPGDMVSPAGAHHGRGRRI